jgi:hypothetical protein
MHNFNEIHIRLMFFKNMSSDFLQYTMHFMGLIEIYPVVRFCHENMIRENP